MYQLTKFQPKDKNIKYKYIPKKKEIDKYYEYIIENNENFIIVNKPAGIPVQSGTKSFKNIIDMLKDTKFFETSKPYIVHRIDKELQLLIVKKTEN